MKNRQEYVTFDDVFAMRPTVLDFAREVLVMHEETIELRAEVQHLQAINEQLWESVNSSRKHNDEMFGRILTAALDGAFQETSEVTK